MLTSYLLIVSVFVTPSSGRQIGGRAVKNTIRMICKGCIFLRVNIKTCFGHIWASSGFVSIKISLYKLREIRYDVEI